MKLLPGESYIEFKKRMMDPISKSFCAAKWVDSTIWLNSGKTASCHHTPAHEIDVARLKLDPMAIHNTVEKEKARKEMMSGERPKECSYCWKIEDLDERHVSDRIIKTLDYSLEDYSKIKKAKNYLESGLKTLEVAFDRGCNFACMYCSPSYSTTWVKDIKDNGKYENLPTDEAGHYSSTHSSAGLDDSLDGVFTKAFWEAWPNIKKDLARIRVTGGEPLISPHFWKLVDGIGSSDAEKLILSVNTNLGIKKERIERLLDRAVIFKNLDLYTSCEAYGKHAEYIRDGLNWDEWTENLELAAQSQGRSSIIVSATINSLSVFSLCKMLVYVVKLREKENRSMPDRPMYFSLNILRNPHFQSIAVLPLKIRKKFIRDLNVFLFFYKKRITQFEFDSVVRLKSYLLNIDEHPEASHVNLDLAKDLKSFLVQYDKRRNKDYKKLFPRSFVGWLDKLEPKPKSKSRYPVIDQLKSFLLRPFVRQ